MSHNIYFSICAEGYGHSSRCLAVAEELQKKGAEILIGSYSYARERCAEAGYNTIEIPREIEMSGENGSFNMTETLKRSLRPAIKFPKIINIEKQIIEEFNADCVVADGRGAAIFAAKKLGIPAITIANQTTLKPFFKHPLHKIPGSIAEKILRKTLMHSAAILIPDLPPPHTVCKYTLSREEDITTRQHYTGPLVKKTHIQPAPTPKPLILTLLGGHPYRKPIFHAITRTAKQLDSLHFLISSKFTTSKPPSNLTVKNFLPDITPYLLAADLVVTQAGHSTAMELITYGKPSILIPDAGQIEQESNAKAMKELRAAETLNYQQLDQLPQTITRILKTPQYRQSAEKLSSCSARLQGIRHASAIIINTASKGAP
jgi:uncharacterized protein (TIGR00661 family)